MQVCFIVLNKVDCLDDLLKAFSEKNLHGATILDSKGMAHSLDGFTELNFTLSLRMLLNPERKSSKTIFMVVKDEEVDTVVSIVDEVTGGLNHADTGILFTMPVTRLEGFKLK